MIKNSFVSLSEQIMKLQNNSLEVLATLNQITSSNESDIQLDILDENDNPKTISVPSVGFLKSEINRINQNLRTISSVDQRGAIIQPAKNSYKKIVVSDLNREPNPISELESISTFMSEKNWFFDSMVNPLLKVRFDLSNKIEPNVRKILSRRYIIRFNKDAEGNFTPAGQTAVDLFNEQFKNRTNISVEELENWINNTPGIAASKGGNKIDYDQQEFELEPNSLEFEGYYTILGSEEDTINRKLWYQIDNLDYYEVATNTKRTLELGSELIINTEFSTTRYRIIEINKESSEIRVRFERIEGQEPIPVTIVNGMKYYSPVVESRNVDISIGFDEYNVTFVKPINTDNHLVAKEWSRGVAYYSNDLNLLSSSDQGDNGKSMSEYYIETVSDFGVLLRDIVGRMIPRNLGIIPAAPVLSTENFRIVQSNKYLTETSDVDKNRKRHQTANTLRSKLDELNKTIANKRKELLSKNFRNPKDRINVENQLNKLVSEQESTTQSLSSTVNEIIANSQNNTTEEAKFKAQGFWQIPAPRENTKTRSQSVIGFRVQYKYSNRDGQESTNEVFKVTDEDGNITNAVFSPWHEYKTPIRERVFDQATQKWIWANEDLSNIDKPNSNSLNIEIRPNERVEIRVKSISEVGYPDSILESEWSNTIELTFPDELVGGRNPQELILKNAELENVRTSILSDLSGQGLDQHLADALTIDNRYYAHISENIAFKNPDGSYVDLSEKMKQIEQSDNIERISEIDLVGNWANYGGSYESAKYYKHQGRVHLSGLIRIDRGDGVENPRERFKNEYVSIQRSDRANTQYAQIAILPQEYRPAKREIFTITSTDKWARVDILPSGVITIVRGYTGWISLSGISFRIK